MVTIPWMTRHHMHWMIRPRLPPDRRAHLSVTPEPTGSQDPTAAAGQGDGAWATQSARGRCNASLEFLSLELALHGIRVWNVQPGFVATERMAQDMGSFGFDASAGAPPDVLGAVVVWLIAHPEEGEKARHPNGRNIEAQEVCRAKALLAEWPG
jgi:NAD(P)-dependent dehydrogenase (short-subunit alcohol dehydrogenase family)